MKVSLPTKPILLARAFEKRWGRRNRNRLGRVIAVTRVFNNAEQYGFIRTVNSPNPKKKGTKEIDLGGRIHGSYHSWRSTGMTTIRNEEMCARMF